MFSFKHSVYAALILSLLCPGASSANIFEEQYGLKPMAIVIGGGDPAVCAAAGDIAGRLEAKGCIHIPPGLIIGYFPPGTSLADFPGLDVDIVTPGSGAIPGRVDPVSRKIIDGFFNERAFQQSGHPAGLDLGPIDLPVREMPADVRLKHTGTNRPMDGSAAAYAALERDIDKNSEFLMGNVLVNVIFPESGQSGSENWTDDEIAAVIVDLNLGLSQYLQATHWVELAFYVNCPSEFKKIPVTLEPIEGDWDSDPYWIMETMEHLSGYEGYVPIPHDYIGSTHKFNNTMRSAYPISTDWVFTAFVADASLNECWQGPSGGYVAYTIFLGGPFIVIPYPACRFGTGKDFAHVFIHEMSHVFWALDEYASANALCSARSGYLNGRNGNSYAPAGYPCGEQLSCIMNNATLEVPLPICLYTMKQVGLGDENENSIPDLYEMAPTVEIIYVPGFTSDTTYDGSYLLSADAFNPAVENLNPDQFEADRVDYAPYIKKGWSQINDGVLVSIVPGDGKWDGARESLSKIIESGLDPGENLIHIIVENCVGIQARDAIGVTYVGMKYYMIDTEAGSDYIDLSWITASQVFGSDFEINRRDATLGTDFEVIETVDGDDPHAPGTTRNYYLFRDENVVAMHLYEYKIVSRITGVKDGQPYVYVLASGVVAEKSLIPVPSGLLSAMAPNPFSPADGGKVSFTVKIPGDFPDVDSPAGAGGRAMTASALDDSRVTLVIDIYNVKGQLVRHLFELPLYGGQYKDMEWDGTNDRGERVSSGIYFVKARVGGEESVKKIVVLR